MPSASGEKLQLALRLLLLKTLQFFHLPHPFPPPGRPNGQPPSAARYMPREVPPRFRCQQDHKVLLKRGQPPPPSCMLLGGGAGPPPSTAPGANPNNAQVTGALLQSEGGTAPGECASAGGRGEGARDGCRGPARHSVLPVYCPQEALIMQT